MSKFARILELENDNQVLLSVEYDSENDCYNLDITTYIDEGGNATIGLSFDSKLEAVKSMNDFTEEQANDYFQSTKEMFS